MKIFAIVLSLSLAAVPATVSQSFGQWVDHHGLAVAVASDYWECLSCHDGMLAPAVLYCTGNCDFKASHSIMRVYPPYGREKEYVPVEDVLAAGVRLFQGRIGCISCHNLENKNRYHLVVETSGSKLCYTCHRR